MDISALILAAEYLEKREKEAEHGYALSASAPLVIKNRKQRPSKAKTARSMHNELEKNRRAHLRHCFDKLKQVVPVPDDSSRHTTLGLLKHARLAIMDMEECHRRRLRCLRELLRERCHLLRHQKLLEAGNHFFRGGHTLSESSSSSSSSTRSSGLSEREDASYGISSPSEDEAYIDGADFDCDLSISLKL